MTFWCPGDAALCDHTKTVPTGIADDTPPQVAVLLCTFQGGRFLAEQLDSIGAQKHKNFTLWASDDGSTDDTLQILEHYQNLWGKERVSIRSGPREGFAANFLSLACDTDIQGDLFAFVDQDDIWEPDKLSRAIARLETVQSNKPALYCSRTRLIDERGREIGFSPLFHKPPGFANALIQNIGQGNTMVMNRAARDLMNSACERDVVYHDWWTYLLIAGAGGDVFYDPCPTVRYRRHSANLMGPNASLRTRLDRMWLLFNGEFRNWNSTNINALQKTRRVLTPDNKRILDEFRAARDRWLLPRLLGLRKSGIYHQKLIGNFGLFVASVLKKI